MTRLILFFFTLLLLSNCSINENTRIWNSKEKKIENQKSTKKLFAKKKIIITEFNQGLKIDLSDLNFKNKVIDNQNNFGSQTYNVLNKKITSYKFSKIEEVSHLNFKPIFLDDGLIFFDKKGAFSR